MSNISDSLNNFYVVAVKPIKDVVDGLGPAGKTAVQIPIVTDTSKTYTGSVQGPTITTYDPDIITVFGSTATDAGNYTIIFSLSDPSNYEWSDGTSTNKTESWSIAKAAGSLSVDQNSLSLDNASLTGTVSVTRVGDGAVSAVSSNTNVATVSVSGMSVTVTAIATGTATVTVSVAAGTNHTAPADVTVSVTSTLLDATMENNATADVIAAIKAGKGRNIWDAGDRMAVVMNGTIGTLAVNDTYYAVLLGWDHNTSNGSETGAYFILGQNAAGTDICFVDSHYKSGSSASGSKWFCHNETTNSNAGGWNASKLRTSILNGGSTSFYTAMESTVRDAIVETTIYSDNTGGGQDNSSYVTSTKDKLWLPSEWEVQGTRDYANGSEKNKQAQFAYYANGNRKIRMKHNNTSAAAWWWMRSVFYFYVYDFCLVNTDGSASSYPANSSGGVAPCFRIA